MPMWTPEESWKGSDAYIIGGGSSLREFDWTLLHGKNTIGCNTAFTLGEKVCKMCFFGDQAWFNVFRDRLARFNGLVFTNVRSLFSCGLPWLWTMERESQGLYKDKLGWNGNTGASALNLALILGAARVFLLGFDMKRVSDKPNWHNEVIRPAATEPQVYEGFVHDFRYVVRDWKAKFPDRIIINVTKDSDLPPEVFPWIYPEGFWLTQQTSREAFDKLVADVAGRR